MQEINRWQRWVLRHNGVEFPQQEVDRQEERKRKQQQKQTLQWRVEKECFDSTKGYPGEGPDTNKDKSKKTKSKRQRKPQTKKHLSICPNVS